MQKTYLIKLTDVCSREDFVKVAAFLQSNKAQIVMALRNCFIAAIDQQLAEVIKKMRAVERIGEVTFRKREVKVIRRSKTHQ
jgi:hypothetical protein